MEDLLRQRKENNWYYVPGRQSIIDLRAHARDIDNLVPFWFGVTEEGTLVNQSQAEVLQIAQRQNLPILAIIHNYSDPQMSDLIHSLLTISELRETLVNSIEQMLITFNFAGINIDFEFVPPQDRTALNTFMEDLYRRLSPNYIVTISVPAKISDDPRHPFSGAFDYKTLSMFSDELFILAYDEHFSIPGPIASIGFVRQVLNFAITQVPRQKIKLGMAAYGYSWAIDGGMPQTLSFQEAIDLAVENQATIRYDQVAEEPTFTYTTPEGGEYIVWFENARSFSAKLDLVLEFNLGGIAVWRLGQEDPMIWVVIRNKLRTA